MCDFVEVIADDPFYRARKTYIFVNSVAIAKAYPIYAVEKNGEWWRCPHDREGAQIITCELVGLDGDHYFCHNKQELTKLGLLMPEPILQNEIGFLNQEGSDKIAIDIA